MSANRPAIPPPALIRAPTHTPSRSWPRRRRPVFPEFLGLILLALGAGFASIPTARAAHDLPRAFAWPTVTTETRPWTYWWWMGSAVDRTNLTRELTRYRDAGLGGVHVIPIYGAQGWDDRALPYLGPAWMDTLAFTVQEARRLGLGVDLTTGTGWCFGGPEVTDDEANALVVPTIHPLEPGSPLPPLPPRPRLQALVAVDAHGSGLDLLSRLSADGHLDWTCPGPGWRLYAITQKPSGQKVKRPAPGGEGWMLNLFNPDGVHHYLERFEAAFRSRPDARPRAMYHDSYEYRSDWAPGLLAEFARRRGYRLETEFPAFFDRSPADPDRAARVKGDYRETLSDLLVESSLPQWVEWSHRHRLLTRNQAHGSPGNLLDLYALADIPETEMFNRDRSRIVSQLASSAAHVAGKPRVSSETGTWLKEHFTGTLADLKYLLDDLYLAGVNHVFYHGTCYSPDEAGWPGWQFYASFDANPRNPVWRDFPALNAYVARCQSILRSGRPDQDLLLYWPIHDLWHQPAGREQRLTVHERPWIEDQPFGIAATSLNRLGYTFDALSDRQLLRLRASPPSRTRPSHLASGSSDTTWRALVVPRCQHLPDATFAALLHLAHTGATVIFEDRIPADVPGWFDLEQRQAHRRRQLADLPAPAATAGVQDFALGRGRILVGPIADCLPRAGIPREPLVDTPGLAFVRRRFADGWHYFVANRGTNTFHGELTLAVAATAVVVMDPLADASGLAELTGRSPDQTRLRLDLEPGSSRILRAFANRTPRGPHWIDLRPASSALLLGAAADSPQPGPTWTVEFIAGGPALPATQSIQRLGSWARDDDPRSHAFAGTARYSTRFDVPPEAAPDSSWLLDLGSVAQSARVTLNGHPLGTLLVPPFRVPLPADHLQPRGNVLAIEVSSVAANRIRDLDRRGIPWRTFKDINFVNLDYRPFTAVAWPLADTGLLGPVTLSPARPAGPPPTPAP